MLRIILKEFEINGYVLLNSSDDLFYLKHRDYDDFWIVCNKEFNLDSQSDIYEQYLAMFATSFPTIKKNTSLVILGAEGAKTPGQIVEIENDPYFFKKYYLAYSQDALKGLISLLKTQDGSVKSVEAMMVTPEAFTQLKEEPSEGGYHLLYAIAHKLPILPVIVNHEEITGFDFQLDAAQEACLDWCLGLSEDEMVRKTTIEQFSREEE